MMDDGELNELARGLVPFVREVVTDAVTTFGTRLAELEARPILKGDPGADGAEGPSGPKGDSGELALLSPELAGQVALAVRMLHESPPLEQRSEVSRPPAKVTRIERDEDGNFVPVYDETQPR